MADAHQTQGATLYMSDASGSPSVFTKIGGFKTYSGPDGQATVIDKTDLDSVAKEKLMGLPDEGKITFELNYITGDAGQIAAKAARLARTRRQFKVLTPAGSQDPVSNPAQTMYFWGFVLSFTRKGGVDNLVAATLTVEIDGPVTDV